LYPEKPSELIRNKLLEVIASAKKLLLIRPRLFPLTATQYPQPWPGKEPCKGDSIGDLLRQRNIQLQE
jgi:hypothetical protein